MNRKAIVALALALGLLAGCSSFQKDIVEGMHNVTAANCSTVAAQQAFVNNLPPAPFITGAQELFLQGQICDAMFGPVAAPATAPGNTAVGAVVVAPAPVASPVASPVPSPVASPAAK